MKSLEYSSLFTFRRIAAAWAGVWLSGGLLLGQTLQNPSFEADTFTVFPGYISGNFPITGWTGTPADRVGLNPAGGQSPFANNGVIPDGSKVAFIQSPGTGAAVLSTVISDLTAGQAYRVNFRLNARTNANVPNVKIAIDDQSIVNLNVNQVQVGSTLPYKYAAFDFTATAPAHTLYLTNDAAGDHTVLVDAFSIAPSPGTWSVAPWSDDATSGVDNTKTYTHAYNFGAAAAQTTDTTINGVPFLARLGANPGLSNEFGLYGFGSVYGSATTVDANAITAAGGGSAALMRQFVYGGNPGYITIANLVPGLEYVATFYSAGWETGIRANTFYVGEDRLSINQDHFGDNQGIRISYRYTAPASGTITLNVVPLYNATFHLYGFSNYELTPQATPVIGLQPRDQVGTVGSSVSFYVTAGGARPLLFQWLKDGLPLPLQTNRVLTLASAVPDDAGAYSVIVSNANGSVTSSVATLTLGTIPNPSFEADFFAAWPGYVTGNFPISGWTVSNPGRVGVNPLPGYPGPFANTGTVPDGTQVALLQSGGTTNWLSTVLGGLTPGQRYTLSFRANGRSDQRPLTRVAMDNQMIGEFRASPVGGTSPYRYIAFDFTPATASPVLSLTNDAAGDHTVLLDDFRLAPSTTKWAYAAWDGDGTSGVDPTRGYSHAYNFGGAGLAVDTVINGVRFLGTPGASPSVSGSFSALNFPGVFGADANTVTTNGGGSALLAQSFLYYSGTIPADLAQTLVLSNLVPGVEYEATIFGVGFDAKYYARSATFTAGEDRMTISEDAFDNNNGLRVTYRYVADASGTMVLTWWPNDRTSSFHTYGFCNAEVASTNGPVVYRQPRGRTVAGGATVLLDAWVGGQTPLFLQWQKDGTDLPDQTNQVLTLAGVTGADTGDYTLVISNAVGMVTSAVARVEVGLAMINSSFEADTFAVYPGYIAGNFPITGWTATLPAQTGLNPAGGQSPFANNGSIPDGAQVAFIQADGGVLSQVVTGMVVGQTYYVKFFENSRSGNNAPTLTVSLGGQIIVPAHTVPAGAYVPVVSAPFLATSDSAELAFLKTAGPLGGDTTVLIDNVAVLELPPTPPAFITQPQSVYVKEGDSITLSAVAHGTLPMSLQWQVDGADLPEATNFTLSLPGILMSQAGNYWLIASNQYGIATSQVATVRVGVGLSELFNTGVDDTGALLEGGAVDPHYQLLGSVDPAWPGPAAWVLYDVWPVQPGVYLTNGPVSKWIAPRTNDAAGNLDGLYTYRTTFLLDSHDPATAEIRGRWAMDNYGVDVRLNGVSLGISNTTGFAIFGGFTITNGFVAGSNTLDFVISNAPPPGPTAVRVELYGVAMPLTSTPPQIVSQPASRMVQEGQEAVFVVTASGSPPLSYQWYYEGFDLGGETNRALRLLGVANDQEGSYTVIVSNPFGSVTSEVAVLTVNAAPQPAEDLLGAVTDVPFSFNAAKLLLNDADPDGDPLSVSAVSAASTNGGSVSLGGGVVTYTPPSGYSGYDLFTYTVSDGQGGSATTNVVLIVGPVGDLLRIVSAPVVQPDGHFRVGWSGVPGYTYTVERATNVLGPWEFFMDLTADPNGLFELDDPNDPPVPARFYRTRYP